MGWRSIHWHRSEYPQKSRLERYADDSWMLLWSPFGHVYIAFKGQMSNRKHARITDARRESASAADEPELCGLDACTVGGFCQARSGCHYSPPETT